MTKFFDVRFMDVPDSVRDICNRYGPQVIGTMLAGGYNPSTPDLQAVYATNQTKLHARDWLTETTNIQDYRERWIPFRDLILEVLVVGLIGWELVLGVQQEKQQAKNFKDEREFLTALSQNTKTTADELVNLQKATDDMRTYLEQEVAQSKLNLAAAQRSAKASEASAQVAQNTLHVSERAYFAIQTELKKSPAVGEKLQGTLTMTNTGKTTATGFVCLTRIGFAKSDVPLEQIKTEIYRLMQIKPPSISVAGAGQNMEQEFASPSELTESTLHDLESGVSIFYVFVDASYYDFQNHQHTFTGCSHYDPISKKFINCSNYNKSD